MESFLCWIISKKKKSFSDAKAFNLIKLVFKTIFEGHFKILMKDLKTS